MFSIRVNLLKWLIAPLLVINLIGAGLAYWLAWVPAQIAFDQSLADTAWALIPQLHRDKGSISIDLPRQAEQILRVDYFDAIYFTVRNSKGEKIAGDNDFPSIHQPENLNNPETYDGSMRGEPIRIIALKTLVDSEPVYIGVAETLRKRNHIRSVIFVALLLLEGLITLVSFAVVWIAVTKGLLPLKKLQTDLNVRSHNDLSSLTAENIPLELHPVVNAINNLLNKVHIGVSGQQNFLANVTHQLRTPLAGLKMQLEWLQQRYASDQETAHSAELMMSSTDRMIRQTNQLLALARAEPTQFEQTRLKLTPLDTLVEESIQHFVEEADKKKIDLGFNLHPTQVMGDDFLLRDMIDNIIDNAIRYTPVKGTITVSCIQTATESIFSVEDTGPGIPESERELIFNRFYRLDDSVAGSGLGLAIVRDIAKDHGATVSITAGSHDKGSVFSVHFPL